MHRLTVPGACCEAAHPATSLEPVYAWRPNFIPATWLGNFSSSWKREAKTTISQSRRERKYLENRSNSAIRQASQICTSPCNIFYRTPKKHFQNICNLMYASARLPKGRQFIDWGKSSGLGSS